MTAGCQPRSWRPSHGSRPPAGAIDPRGTRWLRPTRRCTARSSRPAGSSRIEASYAALARELQLFLVQLQPVWSLERMVTHHEALIVELEQEGPVALRRHLQDGADAVLGAARLP